MHVKKSGKKYFKDTVHGYIQISKEYCETIIDTPLFQRLRRIEQTSMRTLFPCAHHDRFVHSLGTFHVGKRAFSNIMKNSEDINAIKSDKAKNTELENTFKIACLLHDCGHTPFSHTFEIY